MLNKLNYGTITSKMGHFISSHIGQFLEAILKYENMILTKFFLAQLKLQFLQEHISSVM